MAESIIPRHTTPTSEDSNTNKNCFMCQASVDYKINTCTIDIYALVGNRFQRYEFVHMVRKFAGEDSIFTPLGKVKITGVYCDNCKDACSKARLERIEKSKKRHKQVVIFSVVLLLLAVSAFPLMTVFHIVEAWSPWYILPSLVTLLSLWVLIAALATSKGDIASIEKEFTIEAKLTVSDFFSKQLAAISANIDVSDISYKYVVPSGGLGGPDINTETETKATKEENLLFVPDNTVGELYAIDYCDNRYWYSYSSFGNVVPPLVGFDANGNGSHFKLLYTYKYNFSYDGKNPHNVKFKDNRNSNIALPCV